MGYYQTHSKRSITCARADFPIAFLRGPIRSNRDYFQPGFGRRSTDVSGGMKSIVFGGEKQESLVVNVLGYGYAASGNHHDDNWLSAEVIVRCGAFHGHFPASFLTWELNAFHDQLAALYQALKGEARFTTLEKQLELTVTGDGLGHITIAGEACDEAGIGNRLNFQINLDQTQLQASVQSLAAALAACPVRI